MSARRAFTTAELREIAATEFTPMVPHLIDTMRSALLYCADAIDAADDVIRGQQNPTQEAAP